MKNQYVRLFSSLLGITFILSGVIFTFTKTYKDDKNKKIQEEHIIVDEIGNVYQTFFEKENNLTTYRTSLIEKINEYVTYYSQMSDGYDEIIEMIENYETQITEIEDISSYLKDKCTDKYSVVETNEKCNAYYINLEKTINLFIGDMKYFNSKIKEYNEWTKTENESIIAETKYEELNEYNPKKYKEYVDLNNDKTFLGMNEG